MTDTTHDAKSAGEAPEEGSLAEILWVWAGLMLLLAATIIFHFLGLGRFAIVVALLIAAAKIGLVVVFYMHLKYRPAIVWLFAAAALVWLILLFGLSLSDYLTRHWIWVVG